jgi:hypothetical protein
MRTNQQRSPCAIQIVEQFLEVLDAPRCEDDGYFVVDIYEGEAAVFRLHVHRDYKYLTTFTSNPGSIAFDWATGDNRYAHSV